MSPGMIYRYGNLYTFTTGSNAYGYGTYSGIGFYDSQFPEEPKEQKLTPEKMEKYKPTNKKELPCI